MRTRFWIILFYPLLSLSLGAQTLICKGGVKDQCVCLGWVYSPKTRSCSSFHPVPKEPKEPKESIQSQSKHPNPSPPVKPKEK